MPKNKTKFNSLWLNKTDNNGIIMSEWCCQSKASEYCVFCKLCNTDFSVSNQGIQQVLQHSSGKKHLERLKDLEKQTELKLLKDNSGTQGTKTLYSFNLICRKDELVKAEILWALKVVAQNWSFASCDGIENTFRAMFPGSIAKDFHISHTKMSYLITEALGPHFHQKMLQDLMNSSSPFFSIQYDETTNKQNKKELMLKIRFWSGTTNEVVVHHLQTFFMGHAKGADLSKNILNSFDINNLPLTKLLCLGSDGPNVNKTVWRLVNKEVVESRQNGCSLLDIGSCNLHTMHNALKKGLDSYGSDVSELAILVFYWFKRSSAREDDYEVVQVQKGIPLNKFIKHVETRWLTLEPASQRLLQQIEALNEYFLKFLAKQKLEGNKNYAEICKILRKPTIVAEINMVICACQAFSRCLQFFQKEDPMIHLLYEELRDLLIVILSKIVKPDVLEANKFHLHKIKLKENSNLAPLDKMELNLSISNSIISLKEGPKKIFLISYQTFFVNIAEHLLNKTCISNPLIKNLRFMNPDERIKNRSLDDLLKVAKALPLDENIKLSSNLSDEWKLLKYEDLDHLKKIMPMRIDHYWRKIEGIKTSLNKVKYPTVMKVVKAALALPHGNADVERGFSKSSKVVSTDRTNMSLSTLNAIMSVKDAVKGYESVLHLFPISQKLLCMAKQAHSSYIARLEKQKQDELERKRQETSQNEELQARKLMEDQNMRKRKEEITDLSKKVYHLRTEREKTEAVAGSLLEEANAKLKEALKNQDLTGVVVAQLILESCGDQFKKGLDTEKNIKVKEKALLKRQKSVIEEFFSKKPKSS